MSRKIELESLNKGIPAIPQEAVGFYKQNCMICLDLNGHRSGVELVTEYANAVQLFEICWQGDVTPELHRAYREKTRATDFAACTIALILVRELTEFTAVEQSSIGTTIDYYLAIQETDDLLIFNHTARLEVSGILEEKPENTIDNRIRQKLNRLKSESDLPDFIAVVEFNAPKSKIVKHDYRS
jgi:hypothetical protein